MIEFYIINIFLVSVGYFACGIKSSENYKIVLYSSMVVASLMIGIRDINIGQDTISYVEIFKGSWEYQERIEFAYLILVKFLNYFTSNEKVFLIIHALIVNLIIIRAYSFLLGKYSLIAFGVFSCTHVFWLVHIQLLRNGLSSALVVIAVSLGLLENYKKSWLAKIFSVAFHYSSVVPAAWVSFAVKFKFNKIPKYNIIIVLIFGMLAPKIIELDIFSTWVDKSDQYNYYAENEFKNSSIGFQHILMVVLFAAYILYWRYINEIWKKFYIVWLGIVVISLLFWSNIIYRDRLYLPAQIMEPMLLINLVFGLNGGYEGERLIIVAIGAIFWAMGVVFLWGPNNVLAISW